MRKAAEDRRPGVVTHIAPQPVQELKRRDVSPSLFSKRTSPGPAQQRPKSAPRTRTKTPTMRRSTSPANTSVADSGKTTVSQADIVKAVSTVDNATLPSSLASAITGYLRPGAQTRPLSAPTSSVRSTVGSTATISASSISITAKSEVAPAAKTSVSEQSSPAQANTASSTAPVSKMNNFLSPTFVQQEQKLRRKIEELQQNMLDKDEEITLLRLRLLDEKLADELSEVKQSTVWKCTFLQCH